MEKLREILRLQALGYNQSEIARSCDIARSTVQDYLRRAREQGLTYDQVSQLSDSDAQARVGKGKPTLSTVTDRVDFERVHRELQGNGVTLT